MTPRRWVLPRRQCESVRRQPGSIYYCWRRLHRALLVRAVDVWCLWRLLTVLGLALSQGMTTVTASVLLVCYCSSAWLRALLRVPVYLLSVGLTAALAARHCPPRVDSAAANACLAGLVGGQLALSGAVPLFVDALVRVLGHPASGAWGAAWPHAQLRASVHLA